MAWDGPGQANLSQELQDSTAVPPPPPPPNCIPWLCCTPCLGMLPTLQGAWERIETAMSLSKPSRMSLATCLLVCKGEQTSNARQPLFAVDSWYVLEVRHQTDSPSKPSWQADST